MTTENEQLQEALRIVTNTLEILKSGQFPGKFAVPLVEASNYLTSLKQAFETKLAEPKLTIASPTPTGIVAADGATKLVG